jgi:predicted O-linked N-acetylglucosamine transferase (SPINDLY family)
MDYRITDAICDPLGEATAHTETLVRISPCFCCYCPPHAAPEPGPVPCRQTGIVTFGSTHTLARLSDEVLDLWARLLLEIPSSRLLIVRNTLKGSSLALMEKRFSSHSIPENRVIFQDAIPKKGHLAVYQNIDVFLDTFPWSGHATVCEALWMGVPAITLAGNRHAGRMVASVLSCLDMKDFVAKTKEDYLSIAAGLASDAGKLETLRGTLRTRMKNSPMCDAKAFTAKLEAAYRRMWQERCGP